MTDTKDAAQVLRDAGWLVVDKKDIVRSNIEYIGECTRESYEIVRKAEPRPTPDTINWSHVDPKYRYMARGEDGKAQLYIARPEPVYYSVAMWRVTGEPVVRADSFSSYRRGTVDWKDSLVFRGDGDE